MLRRCRGRPERPGFAAPPDHAGKAHQPCDPTARTRPCAAARAGRRQREPAAPAPVPARHSSGTRAPCRRRVVRRVSAARPGRPSRVAAALVFRRWVEGAAAARRVCCSGCGWRDPAGPAGRGSAGCRPRLARMGDEDLLAPDVDRAARPPGVQPSGLVSAPAAKRAAAASAALAVSRITVDADDRLAGGMPGDGARQVLVLAGLHQKPGAVGDRRDRGGQGTGRGTVEPGGNCPGRCRRPDAGPPAAPRTARRTASRRSPPARSAPGQLSRKSAGAAGGRNVEAAELADRGAELTGCGVGGRRQRRRPQRGQRPRVGRRGASGPDKSGHLADAVPDRGRCFDAKLVEPAQDGQDPAELALRKVRQVIGLAGDDEGDVPAGSRRSGVAGQGRRRRRCRAGWSASSRSARAAARRPAPARRPSSSWPGGGQRDPDPVLSGATGIGRRCPGQVDREVLQLGVRQPRRDLGES